MGRVVSNIFIGIGSYSAVHYLFNVDPIKALIVPIILIVIFNLAHYIFTHRCDPMFANLYKFIKYHIPPCKEAYTIIKREKRYIFKERTHMEHEILHVLKPRTNNFCSFTDKFKWSKEKVIDINADVELTENGHKLGTIKRDHNWDLYTIILDREYNKKNEVKVGIKLKNLFDENKESQLFLSSGVLTRTKELVLVVKVEDHKNLTIENGLVHIYNNYYATCPIETRVVDYDYKKNELKFVEQMPIIGYRYMLCWEFREDSADR